MDKDDQQVVRALTAADFEAVIEQEDMVFVDFWAKWCSPCLQFAKTYEKVARLYPDILFASVDLESSGELAELFEIKTVPYLMVFKKGIAIYAEAGTCPESVLKELADQTLAADVSQIRASLDEQS